MMASAAKRRKVAESSSQAAQSTAKHKQNPLQMKAIYGSVLEYIDTWDIITNLSFLSKMHHEFWKENDVIVNRILSNQFGSNFIERYGSNGNNYVKVRKAYEMFPEYNDNAKIIILQNLFLNDHIKPFDFYLKRYIINDVFNFYMIVLLQKRLFSSIIDYHFKRLTPSNLTSKEKCPNYVNTFNISIKRAKIKSDDHACDENQLQAQDQFNEETQSTIKSNDLIWIEYDDIFFDKYNQFVHFILEKGFKIDEKELKMINDYTDLKTDDHEKKQLINVTQIDTINDSSVKYVVEREHILESDEDDNYSSHESDKFVDTSCFLYDDMYNDEVVFVHKKYNHYDNNNFFNHITGILEMQIYQSRVVNQELHLDINDNTKKNSNTKPINDHSNSSASSVTSLTLPWTIVDVPIMFDPSFFQKFLYDNLKTACTNYCNTLLNDEFEEKDAITQFMLLENIVHDLFNILLILIRVEHIYCSYIQDYSLERNENGNEYDIKHFGLERIYDVFEQTLSSLWDMDVVHYKYDCEFHGIDTYKMTKDDFPVWHTFGDVFWDVLHELTISYINFEEDEPLLRLSEQRETVTKVFEHVLPKKISEKFKQLLVKVDEGPVYTSEDEDENE